MHYLRRVTDTNDMLKQYEQDQDEAPKAAQKGEDLVYPLKPAEWPELGFGIKQIIETDGS